MNCQAQLVSSLRFWRIRPLFPAPPCQVVRTKNCKDIIQKQAGRSVPSGNNQAINRLQEYAILSYATGGPLQLKCENLMAAVPEALNSFVPVLGSIALWMWLSPLIPLLFMMLTPSAHHGLPDALDSLVCLYPRWSSSPRLEESWRKLCCLISQIPLGREVWQKPTAELITLCAELGAAWESDLFTQLLSEKKPSLWRKNVAASSGETLSLLHAQLHCRHIGPFWTHF